MKTLTTVLILLLAGISTAQNGTTGKIYGKITGKDGNPLPAASVVIKGEKLGAASDFDGNYFIINIIPGQYSIEARKLGFKPALKENISVEAGKSTKVNFELAASDSYELDQKTEQFYLQSLSENQVKKLLLVKERDPLKYQQMLSETFYKQQYEKQSEQSDISDKILQLTKKIDETVGLYKTADEEELKEKYEKQIYEMLSKRFGLIERKLEHQIQELNSNIDQLKKELMSFRKDKDKIIKGQFESFVK